jgi:hypothetical protein
MRMMAIVTEEKERIGRKRLQSERDKRWESGDQRVDNQAAKILVRLQTPDVTATT